MAEFFIVAESFAAPFCSDQSEHFVEAETPRAALESFAETYKHPCKLYCAHAYRDANAYHKHAEPLAKWQSNQCAGLEAAKQEADRKGCYSVRGGFGEFEIDGKLHKVKNLWRRNIPRA